MTELSVIGWTPGRVARAALGVGVGTLVSLGCGLAPASGDGGERTANVRSPIVGGTESTSAEDFVVYLGRDTTDSEKSTSCGGTLVAPNLVLTAKHCVREYARGSVSICDASGEPQLGSTGGYITGDVPPAELVVYPGVDGRRRFSKGEPPAAAGAQTFDDQTPTLCSHDLAYLLLDKPITDVPIGRLRLGKRPEAEAKIAVAGWGRAEKGPPYNGLHTEIRLRRGGIAIQRVGPPVAEPNATGSLGPRTFETGPGGCSGDSGGPAFDEQTAGVLGVLVRALNTDAANAVSPCAPETVTNVYITLADFDQPLRAAFAAAGAEPWIEGRPAPGYLRFGEACSSNLECEGALCTGLSTTVTSGTCNVGCALEGRTCPTGYVCGTGGACETAPPLPVENPEPDAGPPASDPEEAFVTRGGGCASSPNLPISFSSSMGVMLFAACAVVARRIGIGRRSRT